ncbi:acyl-CoA dehydrogenase family protein [Streptoverticillium reticulum]|uniref:acyl-CoA dehydrogenase family protein n=1 Tax=Streptoverticillium reticulum TaxID=1433415 RepID=UPI0039BF3025
MYASPFAFTAEQERIRSGVRELLHGDAVQRELAGLRGARPQPLPRDAYRALGARGWLAPDWPPRYGGLGASLAEAAVVAEEMALCGVPDSARVNTIDNAGRTLLAAGDDRQKAEHLPAMAAGEVLCCVLYSEPGAGSDLGALRTRAVRDGPGWRLSGEKCWNVGGHVADYGICAARTGSGASRYAGISVFLVPLRDRRVHIEDVPGVLPEMFQRIVLDGVRVPAGALIGPCGGGWQLINDALTLERTGVYLYGRARRWLDLLDRLGAVPRSDERAVRLSEKLAAARLLAWDCVARLASGEDTTAEAAAAKWWNGELASQVARLAWQVGPAWEGGAREADPAAAELADALCELPALSLAAGTSEMMLATVASALLDQASSAAAPRTLRDGAPDEGAAEAVV